MITVDVYKDSNGVVSEFECLGHADYAEAGSDIVCAAVSVLVINTINSIDTFLQEDIHVRMDQETGNIYCYFGRIPSEGASLLLNSMILGLEDIEKNYGNDYIKIIIRRCKPC
ncbi:MAG: ribosomal-processing cysteine protease Prp [Lachnospiraceae bacterium]|nr:ribosomal-processing cysteine protease Prp [Lachnospiraceae bacterium]